MKQSDFLRDFQDILQCDDAVSMDTVLADKEEWDSLAMMASIAYFDKKCCLVLTFDAFKATHTVADIAAFVAEMEA